MDAVALVERILVRASAVAVARRHGSFGWPGGTGGAPERSLASVLAVVEGEAPVGVLDEDPAGPSFDPAQGPDGVPLAPKPTLPRSEAAWLRSPPPIPTLCEHWVAVRPALAGRPTRRPLGAHHTPETLIRALPLADVIFGDRPGSENEGAPLPRVLDPACGAGAFLRVAFDLLRQHTDGDDPTLAALGALHGIDVDPFAAAMCRLHLWDAAGAQHWASVVHTIHHGDALLDDAVLAAVGPVDVVIGNPPFVAFAGRASQRLDGAVGAAMRARFRTVRERYPTTHGAFVERFAEALPVGGRLGLILPAAVATQVGYSTVRAVHDAAMRPMGPCIDLGEGRFPGVTTPTLWLRSIRRVGGQGEVPGSAGAPWSLPCSTSAVAQRLRDRLMRLPTLPASLFAERGLRTGPSPESASAVRIHVGRDIRSFRLAPPSSTVPREALHGRTAPQRFAEVGVVVRQTAAFPIAALHDGQPFRNSVLAVIPTEPATAPRLCSLLNSTLVRWFHHGAWPDARQPRMPQVKIGHLRALPQPPGGLAALAHLDPLVPRLFGQDDPESEDLNALDHLVATLYGLAPDEVEELADFRRTKVSPLLGGGSGWVPVDNRKSAPSPL